MTDAADKEELENLSDLELVMKQNKEREARRKENIKKENAFTTKKYRLKTQSDKGK